MAEIKFEDALKTLEEIVELLEAGDLSLDEALKKYEEGTKLANACNKKLAQMQKRIEVLLKDSAGNIRTENFDPSKFSSEKKSKESAQEESLF